MRKLAYNIRKELLILMRDLPGLAILFLMPLMLIIVITLTQENAMDSVNGANIDILFINHDKSTIGNLVQEGLESSNEINLIQQYKNRPLSDSMLSLLVAKGEFKAGIIIPENTSLNATQKVITDLSNLVGMGSETDETESIRGVHLLFDPAINNVVKRSIQNAVEMVSQGAESKLMTKVLFNQLSEVITASDSASLMVLDALQQIDIDELPQQIIEVDEGYPGTTVEVIKPSITQNNVPAFSLFAMFFIVIPLAGSLIAEKNEGTYDRIRTLPVSYFNILMGKTMAYLLICFMQFILMAAVGIYAFPYLLGLPALEMGNQYFSIFIATLASALSAIGFGLLVGTYSSTHNQAAMFGAILVVIMAALGGIFMPVHMMPESLKLISNLSPLRWGVDSYLYIFVRGTGLVFIWKSLLLLFGFFVVSMGIAAKRFG
jgi:ABC-2 type transport system permease protein